MKHNTPSTCYRKVAVISATEVHDMLNNTWFESCSLYSFFRDNQVLCHINHGALTVLVSKLKAASENIFPWIILETIQKCWLTHLPLTFQVEAESPPFLLACIDQFCVIIIYSISLLPTFVLLHLTVTSFPQEVHLGIKPFVRIPVLFDEGSLNKSIHERSV